VEKRAWWVIAWVVVFVPMTWGQKFELTGIVGGQLNGGLDLSTTLFRRIDVQNGFTRGLGAGYQLGDHSTIEFMWTYNKADTLAQPVGGGADIKIFVLDSNQYFGNFLFHFAGSEKQVRPFLLVGLGATSLSPARGGVNGTTRFAGAVGGGVKYNFSRRFGLRLQAKWSPTYITTTNAGYWCDPFWGGCWAVGDNHYLHELDGTAGLTFRF